MTSVDLESSTWKVLPSQSHKFDRAGIHTILKKADKAGKPSYHFLIYCSKCAEMLTTPCRTARVPTPDSDIVSVRNSACARSWSFGASGRHLCPTCNKAKQKPMTQTKPTPAPVYGDTLGGTLPPTAAAHLVPNKAMTDLYSVPAVREATPEHRRAIFRAIDEAYDTTGRCYVPGVTDQSIADTLKLPRAWVTSRREADFGPAGADPAIAAMQADLLKLKADVEQQVGRSLDAASTFETLGKAIAERLEKVDAMLKRGA